MPAAVGDRNLNSAEYRRVEILVYEALKKLAKRGRWRRPGTLRCPDRTSER